MVASLALVWVLLLPQGGQDPVMDLEQQAAAIVEQRPAEAVALLEQARRRREAAPGEAPEAVVRVLNSLAYALSRADRHDDARATGELALVAAIAVAEPSPWTAAVRRNLAGIAERAGDLGGAAVHAEAAVRDAEAVWGKVPIAAEYREFAALLAMRQGRSDDAIEHLGWDFAIHDQMLGASDPERVANPAGQLGALLRQRGLRGRAIELHDYASALLVQAGFGGGPSWRRHQEARVAALQELGELPAARAALGAAIEGAAPVESPGMRRGDLLDFAGRHLLLGEPERALALLAQVELRQDEPPERWFLQAQAELDAGHWRAALAAADRAEQRLRATAPANATGAPVSAELARLRAAARRGLGAGVPGGGDVGGGQAAGGAVGSGALLEALAAERSRWGEDDSRLLPTLRELVAGELQGGAEVSAELIDFLDMFEACERWRPARELATVDDRDWWMHGERQLDPLRRGWLRLAAARPQRLPAAFAALDRLRQRRRAAAVATAIDRASPRREVAALLAVLAQERDTQATQRVALREHFERALAAVRTQDAALARRIAPDGATLPAVQARLRERGAGLLALQWTDAEVAALWVPGEGAAQVVSLGPAEALRGPVAAAIEALASGRDAEAALAALAGRLLSPLWPLLGEAGQVVVLADGPLALLPLEALPMPGGGGPWLGTTRITYATSAAEWLAPSRASSSSSGRGGGVAHVRRGPGQGNGVELPLLMSRLGPQPGVDAPALDRRPGPDEFDLASEPDLLTASAAGRLRGLRRVEVEAPCFVDAAVPGATSLLLGAPEQDDLPVWGRADGRLDLAELRGLRLSSAERGVADVVLWSVATLVPGRGDAREEGLLELVAAWHDAGADRVLVAGWLPSSRPCFAFDALLREELQAEAPERALLRAQRRWLERAPAGSPAASPAVWARLRCFTR